MNISLEAFGLTIVVGFLFGLLVGILMERAISKNTTKQVKTKKESYY